MADDKQQQVPEDISADVMTPAPDVINVKDNTAIDRIGADADANVQPTDATGDGLTAGVGMYQNAGDRANAQPLADLRYHDDEQYA